ncbi:hypothetical protein E2C01_050872 [Portunus trituberculatus]|uniref:Uncharacterized protein n=1 Tax=Portunus trituberculatus TaxID=210409 RepID=A0A5B7GH48_PORTR|nr:hypothetical protein [Portunus trituberculatus]
MYERWYDGSLGGDLLFRARAQCMDVNARNYRWSESCSKVCQMCDMGEDKMVEYVMLECEKYERDRLRNQHDSCYCYATPDTNIAIAVLTTTGAADHFNLVAVHGVPTFCLQGLIVCNQDIVGVGLTDRLRCFLRAGKTGRDTFFPGLFTTRNTEECSKQISTLKHGQTHTLTAQRPAALSL